MEQNANDRYVSAEPQLPQGAGGGSALFVINLCASIAPVNTAGRNLPGLENYRLYQIARVEDGRTRHRLRLGFFTSEAHAQSVLAVVRQQYPTAFTSSLGDEDRRHTRGYLPQRATAPAGAVTRQASVASAPISKAPVAKTKVTAAPRPPARPASLGKTPAENKSATVANPAPLPAKTASQQIPTPRPTAPKPAVPKPAAPRPTAQTATAHMRPAAEPRTRATVEAALQPGRAPAARPPHGTPSTKQPSAPATTARTDASSSMRVKALDLSFSDPPAPAAAQRRVPTNEPFHVGRGVKIGELPISLHAEVLQAQLAQLDPAPAIHKAPAKAPASRGVAPPKLLTDGPRLADLDSTQTIRALTSAELSDDMQEKWFAIELAASEQPANLDTMPHLDIFEAYRLYSVAIAGGGKIVHSLRLGFFREEVSAEAVSGYLKTFFASPVAVRISAAEQARFKDPPRQPRPDDSKSPAKVIELSDARAARPTPPTLTEEAPALRRNGSGSLRTAVAKPMANGSPKADVAGIERVFPGTLNSMARPAGPAVKRPEPLRKTGSSGKYKTLSKKSLSEQLLDEAREVELSASGIRKAPKNDSLLSRLVGKLTSGE